MSEPITPKSPKHKSTPVRKSKVSASAVNRKVMSLLDKNKLKFQNDDVPKPKTDYIDTFVHHIEQDMRDQMK